MSPPKSIYTTIFNVLLIAFVCASCQTRVAFAYPYDTSCSTTFAVGQTYHGSSAVQSSSRSMSFKNAAGTTIACGGKFTPGDTLSLVISSTSNSYMFSIEDSPSNVVFSSGTRYCSNRRADTNNPKIVTSAATTSITARVGWATSRNTVYITADCKLTPTVVVTPTTAPTKHPTKVRD